MTARALVFTGPESVAIRECAVSDPAADEVLVETACSAISPGTELLLYRNEMPDQPADTTISSIDGELSFPIAYGYAAVGDVIETGSAVDPDLEGKRVFAFHPHQSSFTVPVSDIVPLPDTMDPQQATLLPTMETAVNLLLDGEPRLGERVTVFGAGPVGLCTTRLLAEFPLDRLHVVEPIEHRRELARTFGADETHTPDEVGQTEDDLVYELSGDPTALDSALDVVGYDGRIVVGSWYGSKQSRLSLGEQFHRDRIEIESSQVSTISPSLRGRWSIDRRRERALEQLQTIDTGPMITDRIPFDSAHTAYEKLDSSPETTVQVVLGYE